MNIRTFTLCLSIFLTTLFSSSPYAEEIKATSKSINLTTESSVSDPNENANVEAKVNQKREKIVKEAIVAIEETKKALTALENNKKQDALNAIEKSVGKLEVVLEREPDLALAAIDTKIVIHDLYTSLKDIEQAKKQAANFLEENDIQKARDILKGMASEVVISDISIPLATYPEAMKNVVPLIDAGKTKEAKTALHVALNSLIVTDYIIPLPFIRAEENLNLANSLAEKKDRTEKENTSLAVLLEDTRFQLKMAEALGYGNKAVYETLDEQIDKIIEKTEGRKYGSGYFDEIFGFLSELISPLTENE